MAGSSQKTFQNCKKADESLKPLFNKVSEGKEADFCGEKYVITNDVLYIYMLSIHCFTISTQYLLLYHCCLLDQPALQKC